MSNIDNDGAPESTPVSEARQNLAKLLDQKNAANSEIEAHRIAIRRLEDLRNLDAPHVAALNALSAREANAMAEAAAGASEFPEPDTAAHQALGKAILEARAKSESASRAIEPIRAKMNAAAGRASAVADAISVEAAIIALEAAAPMVEEIRLASEYVARLKDSVAAGREVALLSIERLKHNHRMGANPQPFFVKLEGFNKRLQVALANPAPQSVNTSAPWGSLLARLAGGDATATVGGA
jgi:hypothetical protein